MIEALAAVVAIALLVAVAYFILININGRNQ